MAGSVHQSEATRSVPAPTSAASEFIQLGVARFEPGYWQGMRQSAVLVPLVLTRLEVVSSAVRRFDELGTTVFTSSWAEASVRVMDAMVSDHPVLGRILRLALGVLDKMGMPVMGGATAVKPDPETRSGQWLVGLPAIAENIRAPQAALSLACALMNALAAGNKVEAGAVEAEVKKVVNRFRPLAPAGVNTLRFLQAAHEMDIPWRHVANNVYQFGWGARSRWLDSSFTDETSTISASLARDKVACAKVLRDAGLPVPRHRLVASAEQAVQVAEALGYPVVVKPANLDGGVGVMAGLPDAPAVRNAFAANAKLSKRILVEQFIEGSDHRLSVARDEVLSVVMRRSARVIGDGVKTVQELIEDTNRVRATQTQPQDPRIEQGKKPIAIDDEAHDWLRWQGLSLNSVVALGVSVRLRGAANWSQGGTTRDVLSEAHPDNLDLALRAAAALRLDLAGIDLLIPDITQSWKLSQAAICEVNAQPQYTMAARHRQVLQRLLIKRGRIPLVLIGSREPDAIHEIDVIKQRLAASNSIYWCESAVQCQHALNDVQTEALIWMPKGMSPFLEGLPFDRPDLVIEIGAPSTGWPGSLLVCESEHWNVESNPLAFSKVADELEKWLVNRSAGDVKKNSQRAENDSILSRTL